MKRFLTLAVGLVAIELLTPAMDVGAQSMIAPAIIAAIIGGVASLMGGAMGGKPKGEGHQAQPAGFGGSSGGGGGSGPSFLAGPDQMPGQGPFFAPDGQGGAGSRTPSNYTAKVSGADIPEPKGFTPLSAPPLSRNEAAGGGFSLGTESLELPTTGAGKEGLDSDKALEYAAMAAAIGSLFNAGGPPKPPALSGRGQFDAQPTSMRFLYGGR